VIPAGLSALLSDFFEIFGWESLLQHKAACLSQNTKTSSKEIALPQYEDELSLYELPLRERRGPEAGFADREAG